MCGIVGYVGNRPALSIVLDGLRRLEYRGYDSAGVAVINNDALLVQKRAGKLANLEKALVERAADGIAIGSTAIGHTRWATHGGPTDRNAHPHLSADGRVAVIHNGIIENFARLRAELEATGVEFASDTDTECAAHLLAAEMRALRESGAADGPHLLAEGMRRVCRRLEGAFTLLAVDVDVPDAVVGARRNSPLVVGRGDGENYLASDVSAFIEHTREAVELGQDQVVLITPAGIEITDFAGEPSTGKDFHIDWDASAAEKGGYDYFMLKEIAEQPQAVADTLLGRLSERGEIVLDEVRLTDQDLRDVDKVFIVACGTAYHAGLVAKYAIEHWTRIPCEVELASEFRYRDPVLDRSTLVVAISQSGETMDTLMALRHAKEQKARVLAICNTNGSTIPRESDAVLYTHGGPEIAVASTKAFLTQLVACYLIGLHLAQVRGVMYADEVAAVVDRHGERARARPRSQDRLDRAFHRPARRLSRGPGRRAQAQGTRLHARGGLRGGRAQARPDRADRPGHAGGLHRAVAGRTRCHAGQGRLQHPGGPGPRRPDDRDRRGGRRGGSRLRRPPDRGASYADAAGTPDDHGPAADPRVRDRGRPGPRRRPAPQPGQVGHRGVTSRPTVISVIASRAGCPGSQ
jgi:glucosamine--fructose-6-phosphate aminotransferase (isomerizing)